jgi:hypothetical protein
MQAAGRKGEHRLAVIRSQSIAIAVLTIAAAPLHAMTQAVKPIDTRHHIGTSWSTPCLRDASHLSSCWL